MKTLLRPLALWLVLAVLAWLMGSGNDSDRQQFLSAAGLFLLPPLAVWLTAKAASARPARWWVRVGFWAVTLGGWLAAIVLAQGRAESAPADQRASFLLACGLAAATAAWLAAKTRTLPAWRVLREAAAGGAFIALAGAIFAWSYAARTRATFARAEARWSEVGLPMAEFEKTLAPSHENTGSAVVRQVLREQVGTRFYKEGTAAAAREPAVERSVEKSQLISRACEILCAKLPPSDDLDLAAAGAGPRRASHPPARDGLSPVAALESAAPALEADCARILAAEPAAWAADPHDGYAISVPNFLGVRMFAQLTAAEAMRRCAAGDPEGAARATAAGLRVSESLRQNPTLVALMIHVTTDTLLASKQVWLPATDDGLASVARDVPALRAEFFRRMQLESWACLRFSDQIAADQTTLQISATLPKWAGRLGNGFYARRQFATAALNGAEHAALYRSPAILALPDFGDSLHEAISLRHPTIMEPRYVRALMRIHTSLLLREQTALIRDARACLAAGRPVASRASAVLPGVRWELTADAEKNTVATRLAGAPEWVANNSVTGDDFWLIPLDGSIAWQFRSPARTAHRL